MKRLYLLAVHFLIVFSAAAQLSIRGTVTSGQTPLSGATVSLKGAKNQSAQTNDQGVFVLNRIAAGNYSLVVSYTGYGLYTKALTLSADQTLSIDLSSMPMLLDGVEVKATRAGEKAPFAKTNISRSFIEKNNIGQDIPYLLNQTPNVVVNSDAGNGVGYTAMRIRGTDATRINMTINGIPYNDAESQGTFFVNMPDFLSSVNSIQLQRGVGTSSNGAGAFGATMNFSTNSYNPQAYAELNNSFGSFNTWKNTVLVGSGLLAKHFTVDARFSNISSDGFIDRASSKLQSAYLSAAYWGKKTQLRFNAILGKEKTYQAWNGIPQHFLDTNRTFNSAGTERPGTPYDNETDNYWQNHFQLFWNQQLNGGWTFNTALFYTPGHGYYEQYKAGEDLADYGIPAIINGSDTVRTTDLVRRLWLDNHFFGQVLSLQQTRAKHQLTFGGGWNRYLGNHFGDVIWTPGKPGFFYRWYDHNAYKTDINVFVKYQRKISTTLELFTDLQYRFVNYKISGFRNNPGVKVDADYNFVNPKAGLSYTNKEWSAFISYAMGQKEPNRDDFEAGTTQLPKREQLHDVELNVSRKNIIPGLSAAVTFYYMYYKDQLVLTGKINDVGAYTRSNLPNSYRAGAELELKYVQPKWNVSYNGAFSSNKVKDFTEYLDDYDNGGQLAGEPWNHGYCLLSCHRTKYCAECYAG